MDHKPGQLHEIRELTFRPDQNQGDPHEKDAEAMVNTIPGRISDTLVAGDRMELRGFGAFTIRSRNARLGRNPKTGEAVQVIDKLIPVFKTGKTMQIRLNASGELAPAEMKVAVERLRRSA